MNNFREVNEDILKDWLEFREDAIASLSSTEDKKHFICFEEILERILKNVPDQNKKYVERQLKQLDDNSLITSAIGMRSIIEMVFVMGCS